MPNYTREGMTFNVPNGAVRLERTVYIDGQPREYKYAWQLASGPCAVLAFINTWSLIYGQLPNISFPALEEGVSRETWTKNFALLYGGNINSEDMIELSRQETQGREAEKANQLIEYLNTYPEGTMVCGMEMHCTVVQKYKDSYAIIDANNRQGAEIVDKDRLQVHLARQLGKGEETNSDYRDFFFFPHH